MNKIYGKSPEIVAAIQQFGCPPCVADALIREATPLLRAIKRLEPQKVKWLGDEKWLKAMNVKAGRSGNELTAWSLYGKRASLKDILGIVPP